VSGKISCTISLHGVDMENFTFLFVSLEWKITYQFVWAHLILLGITLLLGNEQGIYLMMVRYIFNCNWIDTRWQQYSTHLHTTSTQDTENGSYISIKKLGTSVTIKKFKANLGRSGCAPSLWVILWHLPYD
jgi:hypothetical protein